VNLEILFPGDGCLMVIDNLLISDETVIWDYSTYILPLRCLFG
jgi:hypothetical protein